MSTTKAGVAPVSGTEKKLAGGSGAPKPFATEHGDASSKVKVETEEKKKKIRVNLDTVAAVKPQDVPCGPNKMGTTQEDAKTTQKSNSALDKEIKVETPIDDLSEIPTPPDIKPSPGLLKLENYVNNEMKAGVVSFTFKKTGAKIANVGVFGEIDAKQKPPSGADHKHGSITSEATTDTPNKTVMSTFVKVISKEDIELDWPDEMIQCTKSEPVLSFSCNPLYFDFTQLLTRNKKAEETLVEDLKNGNECVSQTNEVSQTEEQIVIAEREAVLKQVESGISADVKDVEKKTKKKRKRSKHKKHHIDEMQEDKKKHSKKKKKKKKHKHHKEDVDKILPEEDKVVLDKKMEETGDYDGDMEVEEPDKSKNRSRKKKKSKKSKHKRKKKHTDDQEKEKKEYLETPKKIKKSHNPEKNVKSEAQSSSNESDNENEKDVIKRKKKKRKHKHSEEKSAENETRQQANSSNCIALAEMESAGDLVFEKSLPTVNDSQDENKVNSPEKDIKLKEQDSITERRNSSVRKRQTSESSVPEILSSSKKIKLTPKINTEDTKINKDNKGEENLCNAPEDSWSKMEGLYECREQAEIQKSKWDTSDSESENVLERKTSKKSSPSTSKSVADVKKTSSLANNIDHTASKSVQKPVLTPKTSNPSTDAGNSDNPGHVADNQDHITSNSGQTPTNLGEQTHLASKTVENIKILPVVNTSPQKSSILSHSRSRKISTHSHTASSDSSASRSDDSYHSRRKRHRSYSKDSYRSHSSNRSYSSSSYNDSHRHSSHSRSYSRSRTRSRSRSRSRRHRSRSYTSYSESDQSSRSRSRSSRRHYSRSSRSRSRSYSRRRHSSYSSYSSRSRSRSRCRNSRSKKRHRSRSSRRRHSRTSRSASHSSRDTRNRISQDKKKSKVVCPLDIPLPNLDEDEAPATPTKLLQKIKEKKRQNSDLVKKGIAKAKQSDKNENEGYINIPLPMLNDQHKDIEPCDQNVQAPPGFQFQPPPPPPCNPEMWTDQSNMELHSGPGSMMAPPPPPPPGHGNMPPPHRMHPPRPYMGPLGPGPGPRFFPPPHRMRPPNHRMGPPPMHNGPGRPPFYRNPFPMRPPMRHPPPNMGNHGPPPDQWDRHFNSTDQPKTEQSPPPLPPPKSPSPQPPPLPKEEEEKKTEEPTQNLSIVIPPEQAEQYRRLQEQAQKHAKRQLRKQKQDNGEIVSDSSSEEEDDADKQSNDTMEEENPFEQMTPTLIQVPMSHALALQQPTLLLAQPQPAASPLGGLTFSPQFLQASPQQQILFPGSAAGLAALPQAAGLAHASLPHGFPLQTGQPIIAVPGPQPAHLAGALPFHFPGMQPAGFPLSAGAHPLLASPSPFMTSPGMPIPLSLATHLQQTLLTPTSFQHAALQAAGGIPQGHVIGHQIIGNQLVRIIRPHM